jgi:DNA-binding Xre family transcriptional regulator
VGDLILREQAKSKVWSKDHAPFIAFKARKNFNIIRNIFQQVKARMHIGKEKKTMDVRNYIGPAIENAGMKKQAVALRAGLNPQKLCDVIAKRRKLDANELVEICRAINITPNELLGFGVERQKEKEVG